MCINVGTRFMITFCGHAFSFRNLKKSAEFLINLVVCNLCVIVSFVIAPMHYASPAVATAGIEQQTISSMEFFIILIGVNRVMQEEGKLNTFTSGMHTE